MRRADYAWLAVLGVVVYGTLAITGGYAWYWRSAAYREYCANRLSAHLGLEGRIGRVVLRSRTAREFQDVHIALPDDRGTVAHCDSALLTYAPTADDPEAYELVLRGGATEISTRTWLREDYRFVLESGLRPGFDPDGPRRAVFSGMDLTFERESFRGALHGAGGVVSFEDPHRGRAWATCRDLNGHVAAAPVQLVAEFSPQEHGIRLDRVELDVPELPIAIVGFEALAGVPLRTGAFQGRLVYTETAADRVLAVSGRVTGAQLAEVTAGFVTPPWRGAAPDVELRELTLRNERLERVRFGSLFTDVLLADVLRPWGLADVGGELDRLFVSDAEISAAGLERFIASARCDDIALAELSAALGWGQMTGTAQLVVHDLTITDNHLASLDAEIHVRPTGDTGTIDRALLTNVLARVGGISLPAAVVRLLPERFAYTQLGVRFEVVDELLTVFGTHGPGEKTILSIELGGQEWPVLPEPEQSFDLRPALDALRLRLQAHFDAHWRGLSPDDAWQALSTPRAGRPGSRPTPLRPPQE